MNEFDDMNSMGNPNGEITERSEASSNIFLDLAETDSTGIPSLKQAPSSAIASSESDSKINGQIIIAGLVLAIGAGAIYGMRYVSMQAGLDDSVVKVDYTADVNSAEFNQRFDKVMQQLDESELAIQIADTQTFAHDPFERKVVEEVEMEPIDPGVSEEERMEIMRQREQELAIQRRRDLVFADAMRFQLQGVVGGSRAAARISGVPVRVGSELGDFFKVIEITGRSVVIEGDGMQFELMMGQETILISE